MIQQRPADEMEVVFYILDESTNESIFVGEYVTTQFSETLNFYAACSNLNMDLYFDKYAPYLRDTENVVKHIYKIHDYNVMLPTGTEHSRMRLKVILEEDL